MLATPAGAFDWALVATPFSRALAQHPHITVPLHSHPHQTGIGRQQQKSRRIAEVDRDQRREESTPSDVISTASQASPEQQRPPPTISDPWMFFQLNHWCKVYLISIMM
jgi:hypothetical protein